MKVFEMMRVLLPYLFDHQKVDGATHKKRGSSYILFGVGEMQAADWRDHNDYTDSNGEFPSVDGRSVMVYIAKDGTICVRPELEFRDGRFDIKEIEND